MSTARLAHPLNFPYQTMLPSFSCLADDGNELGVHWQLHDRPYIIGCAKVLQLTAACRLGNFADDRPLVGRQLARRRTGLCGPGMTAAQSALSTTLVGKVVQLTL